MNSRLYVWILVLGVIALGCAQPATSTQGASSTQGGKPPQDEELAIGQAGFDELKAKGEIIESSPLYDTLLPIIQPILKAAQPRYNHPFKVYLVHEPQPNAFATPGGYIYVVDELLYFVKNKEELAGTLAHEVSHTIHHDSMELLKKQEEIQKRELGAAVLLGPTRAHILAIALLGQLRSMGYSREAESRADLTGSDLCAAAGTNPWGLVWLFRDFSAARQAEVPQMLSDHPSDQNRINALEQHFRANQTVFGRFDSNPRTATPLKVSDKVAVVFMR